jgi:XTP/dITP diphosphohydrolase
MGKLASVTSLLIATRNLHKVEEIRAILGQDFRYLTLQSFPGAPEVVEDMPTFSGNATKKAVQLAKWLAGIPNQDLDMGQERAFVLADDSGLEVDVLGGAPGVYSARFAALDTGAPGNSPTAENNAKLLRLLQGVPPVKRTARFHCAVALTPVPEARAESASPVCYADEAELSTELFQGICEGHIVLEPRGGGGFGYDPLFVPSGYDKTFGELPEAVKNQLSHRAKALEKLKARLSTF